MAKAWGGAPMRLSESFGVRSAGMFSACERRRGGRRRNSAKPSMSPSNTFEGSKAGTARPRCDCFSRLPAFLIAPLATCSSLALVRLADRAAPGNIARGIAEEEQFLAPGSCGPAVVTLGPSPTRADAAAQSVCEAPAEAQPPSRLSRDGSVAWVGWPEHDAGMGDQGWRGTSMGSPGMCSWPTSMRRLEAVRSSVFSGSTRPPNCPARKASTMAS